MVDGLKIGDYAITTRTLISLVGRIICGTRVKITGISDRGYDLVDEQGNTVAETGFDSVRKE